MIDKDTIEELIKNGIECEYLDFKAASYVKLGKEALIKDIMAMANSKHEGNKYIITGIKDRPDGSREVLGIPSEELSDDSKYQQLIHNKIEPEIPFQYFCFTYQEKQLGIFEISHTLNKPFIVKRNLGKLQQSLCLVRKGSQQSPATRKDFDTFYTSKESFEIKILDSILYAVHEEEGCADLRVTFRNLTSSPVTLIWGRLNVKNKEGIELSRHNVYGMDKRTEAGFIVSLPPHSEKTGELYVGFTSNDCLRLGLDEYGGTDEPLLFELKMGDTMDKEYVYIAEEATILARGKFLWKVRLRR